MIRRCIHPRTDIAALDLLDAERNAGPTRCSCRRSGSTCTTRPRAGELDDAYGYARASLLHFARWMAKHEYPYLEKPQVLEFPTETWAAQDMRKSEVFDVAALHAASGERDTFLERGRFFFDYSVRTLLDMPSHTLTRPTVLMLSYGWLHAFVGRHPGVSLPDAVAAGEDPGTPCSFVPQKARALRRAKWLAAASGVATLLAAAALILLLR